ncbi:hypothetical protein [Natrarchaeobaculum sulfurireducens]|uniref:ABC-type nickel/cobalt efflux system, permease component RcnA n=1 Tax=Natrarchaeobaculum sulfurireducens TaxID=2044521 RepID=A0A346PUN6_9EURY|nr:hypothetical protein [Natrarchaeobaculum sulfurireducens]AXR79462.1 ABC-type nickel/cobalt efflux system, permease component RcnA [Natrarchaeobaculum sulfurireducens]AXR83231.1 hypothetical protein AArcMg_3246 [Natrarchaeobaculum sulfurireducens]
MPGEDDTSSLSRRRVLQAAGTTITISAVATGSAAAQPDDLERASFLDGRCPEATIEPSMGPCEGASMGACADDHPATVELRAAVEETLEERYPDAGALADAGFKPYFDTLDHDDDGWSHWLSPEYIGDDVMLDPERPESVLVDNESWRSIGVMFIATLEGEAVEAPTVFEAGDDGFPGPVYEAEPLDLEAGGEHHAPHDDHRHEEADDHHDDHDHHEADDHGSDHDDHAHHPDGDPDHCAPWHAHTGLPGRFSWWFYRQAYEQDFADGDLRLPCRTPCMMHVWTVDHPEGVYAHDGPPAEYRDVAPADDPDLETDAEPGEDDLGWDVLPDDLVPDQRPDDFSPFDW